MKAAEDRTIGTLREKNIRVTPQRALIWRILAAGGHFTAAEIRERAGGALPGLERSTVYRTLEAFREAGMVTESAVPGGPRVFEADPEPHSHLFCEGCSSISHPDNAGHRRTLEGLLHEPGFEARDVHVLVTGLCSSCVA